MLIDVFAEGVKETGPLDLTNRRDKRRTTNYISQLVPHEIAKAGITGCHIIQNAMQDSDHPGVARFDQYRVVGEYDLVREQLEVWGP